MRGRFCWLGARKNRAERQPRKFEILTLVACVRPAFSSFWYHFLGVFILAKTKCLELQHTISSFVFTYKYSRLSHLDTPSCKTQYVNSQSVTLPGKRNDAVSPVSSIKVLCFEICGSGLPGFDFNSL